MILFPLAYLAGVLTIVSPCILPVLPFVFARAGQPFRRGTLPLLAGMAVSFAAIATLAAVGGGWAVAANAHGRLAAMVLLGLFGLALLFPAWSEAAMRPLVRLGDRLSASRGAGQGPFSSLVLGIATGLLWAPCAGPVLGLILTGAALNGPNAQTSLLLLAYAAGAATALALALLAGNRALTAMKRSLGGGQWLRRAGGAAVLVAVGAIALGLDTGFLTRVSLGSTATLEQGLIDHLQPADARAGQRPATAAGRLPVEGAMPPLAGAVAWLNGPPLTAEGLRGKVVLVNFWTYSCINCLRALPHVRAWYGAYGDKGLVVIGVHAPEFAFEKDIGQVRKAVADLRIGHPVAIDNDFAIWRAFANQYWPARYLIDAEGRIRHHHFGEGAYDATDRAIRQLLEEAGSAVMPDERLVVEAEGAEAPSAVADLRSPEAYVGYRQAGNFASPGGMVRDAARAYAPGTPLLNQWGLSGTWTVGPEHATLDRADGGILHRFHARDLHLVLAPAADGRPVRFRVTIDGAPPGRGHGSDVDADGQGVVTGQRLYQLVRQAGPVVDRQFEIRFLDPGVRAYAFTFG